MHRLGTPLAGCRITVVVAAMILMRGADAGHHGLYGDLGLLALPPLDSQSGRCSSGDTFRFAYERHGLSRRECQGRRALEARVARGDSSAPAGLSRLAEAVQESGRSQQQGDQWGVDGE